MNTIWWRRTFDDKITDTIKRFGKGWRLTSRHIKWRTFDCFGLDFYKLITFSGLLKLIAKKFPHLNYLRINVCGEFFNGFCGEVVNDFRTEFKCKQNLMNINFKLKLTFNLPLKLKKKINITYQQTPIWSEMKKKVVIRNLN